MSLGPLPMIVAAFCKIENDHALQARNDKNGIKAVK